MFLKTLKTEEINEKLNRLEQDGNMDAQSLASELTNTLLDVTKRANINPSKAPNGHKNEPWFDKDCIKLKNSLKSKCKKLRKNHDDFALHYQVRQENKRLRNLIKTKKYNYKQSILEDLKLHRKDQRAFWKILDKLQPHHNKTNSTVNVIPGKRWVMHFESILQCKGKVSFPPDSIVNGPLDYDVTQEELDKASYVLKPNKASGFDSISNEMLKCLLHEKPGILIKLFNNIIKGNSEIQEWITTIISPIFKKGNKTDPQNYRGISIISCLLKLFESILNMRLTKYCQDNHILRDEQLGFREGNRTSDAHLILHSLITQYCQKNNKKIFSCFVDFKQAFDSIPRDLLFEKLLSHGINGKFFNALKNLYKSDYCCVKIGEKITKRFVANQGVKQGSILSPLLFNIFVSDMPDIFSSPECKPVRLNNLRTLGHILWADDLVLMSESDTGLQKMLSNLTDYSSNNQLVINIDKTKAMIFNKSGRFIRASYNIKNAHIYTTKSYKYLGLIFTPSGKINTALNDLKDRALRAFYKLKLKLGHLFRNDLTTTISLFNALIKPILLYASDFWGCLKLPKNNPIENVQMRFYKEILGVQRQTCNIGVLFELGEIPITIYARKNCINNYFRIKTLKRVNNLTAAALRSTESQPHDWYVINEDLLRGIGIGISKNRSLCLNAFIRMKDIFHQEAFTFINRDDSKLRTYGKVKTSIGIEKYLLSNLKVDERTYITKLRLSNHDLMIEKGRHQNIHKSQRFCPFCPNQIETEQHFLLQCRPYAVFRNDLFLEITNLFPSFMTLEENEKFACLLNNEKLIKLLGSHLLRTFECRKFLIGKHKNPF